MVRSPFLVLACAVCAAALVSACAPATPPPTLQSTPVMVPVTGTPFATVFVIPTAVPSATVIPPASDTRAPTAPDTIILPANCYRQGLPTYINREAGLCFAFPQKFTVGEFNPGEPAILGPALDSSPDPLRATLTVQAKPAAGTSLADHLSSYALETGTSPESVSGEITIGGETGKVMDPVKGRPNARAVLVLHGDNLYVLSFAPTLKDTPAAQQTDVWKRGQQDMEALYTIVAGSFAFLTPLVAAQPPGTKQPMPMLQDISWQTAQEMILGGQVTAVSQSHSLKVSLTLKDGRVLRTVEPQIDEVIRLVNQCGAACRAITVATE